jgi:hypothetical protein
MNTRSEKTARRPTKPRADIKKQQGPAQQANATTHYEMQLLRSPLPAASWSRIHRSAPAEPAADRRPGTRSYAAARAPGRPSAALCRQGSHADQRNLPGRGDPTTNLGDTMLVRHSGPTVRHGGCRKKLPQGVALTRQNGPTRHIGPPVVAYPGQEAEASALPPIWVACYLANGSAASRCPLPLTCGDAGRPVKPG